MHFLHCLAVIYLAYQHLQKKEKGHQEKALTLSERLFPQSFYQGALSKISKNSVMCPDLAEAISMAEIAFVTK
jgi:hypothetical protein